MTAKSVFALDLRPNWTEAAPDRGPQSLAASVILMAFQDATTIRPPASGSWYPLYRDEAISFLISPRPDWTASRAAWCSFLDIDPADVRRAALMVLGGEGI